ncbi:hypothetical protein HYS72_00300 [Candidatus Pacearchaeota archaeon]|nr:hypothetical protein [Candidatus Pacearchaeota archaeon]
MTNTITEKNKKALDQIALAQEIVTGLIKKPEFANFHHPALNELGDARRGGEYVLDKLYEVCEIYRDSHPEHRDDVPKEVKHFIRNARYFLYGGGN